MERITDIIPRHLPECVPTHWWRGIRVVTGGHGELCNVDTSADRCLCFRVSAQANGDL